MKTFRINWTELVKETYSVDINAESEEEAKSLWEDDPYSGDFEYLNANTVESNFTSIKELKD